MQVLNGVEFTDPAEYERAKTLAIIHDLQVQLEEVKKLPGRIGETAVMRIEEALLRLKSAEKDGEL